MIDLTGKSVLVRTREEYEKVLKIGKEQGFCWGSGKSLEPYENQMFPNILNFHLSKTVTYFNWYPIVEATELFLP